MNYGPPALPAMTGTPAYTTSDAVYVGQRATVTIMSQGGFIKNVLNINPDLYIIARVEKLTEVSASGAIVNERAIAVTDSFTITDDSMTCSIGNLPSVPCRIAKTTFTIGGNTVQFTISQWVVEADTTLPNGKPVKKDTAKVTLNIVNWPVTSGNSIIATFNIQPFVLSGGVTTTAGPTGVELVMAGLGAV